MSKSVTVILATAVAFELHYSAAIGVAGQVDDYPTDRDLKAAYCQGVWETSLKDPAWQDIEKIKPGSKAVIISNIRHVTAYFLARGYFDEKDALRLLPAKNQGANDSRIANSIADQCLTAECLKKFSSSPDEMWTCLQECRTRLDTLGVIKKLQSCSKLVSELPF